MFVLVLVLVLINIYGAVKSELLTEVMRRK